jgi:Phosphodiester glycosidase
MSVYRKVGRFRVVVSAVALAIVALAALPAQPAVAEDACTDAVNSLVWQTIFNSRGVTMCLGNDSTAPEFDAYVQIIDLNAGAKVRLESDACNQDGCPGEADPTHADLYYHKRTAGDWYDWIKSHETVPAASRLFSTSNASFFTTLSGDVSTLSLPESHNVNPSTGELQYTWGGAYVHRDDPAWNNPKLAILLGNANTTKQNINMTSFPTHYTDSDVQSILFNDFWGDATVAYPTTIGAGASPRTIVGVDEDSGASKFYVLNTSKDFTITEAQQILSSFGATFTMQFDGGGSTQLYSNGSYLVDSDDIGFDRVVPEALAVYLAP